jgi:16S rRNA (guanine527-N7)-methyltransferase
LMVSKCVGEPERCGQVVDFSLPVEAIISLAGDISEHQAGLLHRYGEGLLRASSRSNLVSRKSVAKVAEHFVDSAALLAFRELEGATVGDLGSGGGFPGLVVAVLRPGCEVTLVEARRPKVVFLKSMVRDLGLSNVKVSHTRIENLESALFNCAVARALGRAAEVLPACLRTVAGEGSLILFKGPAWQREAKDVECAAAESGFRVTRIEKVALPGLGRETTFVELARPKDGESV